MEKDDTFTTDPQRVFRFSAYRGPRHKRDCVLGVGMTLAVEPLNPKKTKHRGRVGRVSKIRLDYVGQPVSAHVVFADELEAGKWGVVDAADLRPLTPHESESLAQGRWPPEPS